MTSDNPPCAGDPLVATWARPGQGQTWSIHDDCTWSMVQRESEDTGTWSRSGAKVTFTPDASSHLPTTTVIPDRAGDRLATPVEFGPGPVSGPQLLSSTEIYAKLSGGDGLADTVWGADTRIPDQGGSCSYFEETVRLMLQVDGTATHTFQGTCQPANMPYTESMSGTWTAVENGAALVFQITTPSNEEGRQTWVRFSGGFAIDYFVRVP